MKKIHIRILIGVGVILLIVTFLLSQNQSAPEETGKVDAAKKVSLIDIAKYQSINSGIESTGEVESLEQVELRSKVSQRISRVQVSLGQQVSAGTVIAVLDNAALVAQRTQRQAEYQAAIAQKDQLQAQYIATKANYEKTLVQAQNAIAASKSALDVASNSRNKGVSDVDSRIITDAYDDAFTLVRSIRETVASVLAVSDGIIGVDDRIANDIFEDYLSPLDASALNTAQNSYQDAAKQVSSFNTNLAQTSLSSPQKDIDQLLIQTLVMLDAVTDHLLDVSLVIDNTRAIGTITQTQLDGFRDDVLAARTNISTKFTAVVNQQQAIVSAKTQVTDTDIAYEKALRDFEDAQQEAKATIAAAQAQVDQAASTIRSQEAQIQRAQGAIDGVNASIGDTIIRSPIRGTIAVLPASVGEWVSAGSLVASVVNTDGLQIIAYIDSSDLASVAVGNKVVLDEEYAGVVTHVAPSIDPITKKVEVIVAVSQEDAGEFVAGEFATIRIQRTPKEGNESSQSLLLPFDSIRILPEKKVVYVVGDENRVREQEVLVDRIVEDKIEVISGLEDIAAIVASARNIEAGQVVEITPAEK